MNIKVNDTLDRLATALASLPEDAQAEILAEIESCVGQLTQSSLNNRQRAVLAQRLAGPRTYASPSEVAKLLESFDEAQ